MYLQKRESGIQTQLGLAMFVCVIVFYITSTVSVLLRLYAKHIKKQPFCAEDWVIMAAQISVYCMGAVDLLIVTAGGGGLHMDAATPDQIVDYLKLLICGQIFYATSMALVKISICLFLIRVFSIRKFRIAAYVVLSFIVAWGVMIILTAFLLCMPFEANWNKAIGHCGDQVATFIAVGALDLIVDAMVLVLPLPFIWQLKISKGDKIALTGIFGLGIFTMVISGLRLQSLLSVDFADFTYTAALPSLWTFLEPAIGVTVACLPLMRPLLGNSKMFRRLFQRTSAGTPANSRSFKRMGDEYVMSDASSKSKKPYKNSGIISNSEADSDEHGSQTELNAIRVTKQWDVAEHSTHEPRRADTSKPLPPQAW